MKKKTETKVERKENVLSGNALELNDADLEGAAGGMDGGTESAGEQGIGENPSQQVQKPIVDILQGRVDYMLENYRPEAITDPEQSESVMEKIKEGKQLAKEAFPWMK